MLRSTKKSAPAAKPNGERSAAPPASQASRPAPPPVPSPAPAPAKAPPANAASASEDQVRLLAYQKWEAAGRPPGDGAEFWLEAERELLRGSTR